MPIFVSAGTVARVEDDVAGVDLIAYRNDEYAAPVHSIGNFAKAGNSLFSYLRFDVLPTLPAGVQIDTAKVEVTANSTQSGAFFTVIRIARRDGVWDPIGPTGPQSQRLSQPPVNSDFRLRVRNTGGGNIFNDTLTFTGASWEMRANSSPGRFERLEQGFSPTTAGPLGDVTWQLSRTSTIPSGNIWVGVFASDSDGLATGTPLATSATRPASVVTSTGSGFDVVFGTFDSNPTLSLGNVYVAKLLGDYPINGTAFIRAQWEGQTGGNVQAHPALFGSSIGFDDQAYGLKSNWRGIPFRPEFLVVVLPTFTAGVRHDLTGHLATDLKAMFQALVDDPAYVEGEAIAIRLEVSTFLLDANDRRDYKSSPGNFPTLTITYRERTEVTTLTIIREKQEDAIEALTPDSLSSDKFRIERAEIDFKEWCEANPTSCFRRFSIDDTSDYVPPAVVDHDIDIVDARLDFLIAYPKLDSMYGTTGNQDREDIMSEDMHLINDAIGERGARNYVAGQHRALASTKEFDDPGDDSPVIYVHLVYEIMFNRAF